MKKLDYIFIDLDGTLLEGKYKHYKCYEDIINENGGIPLDIDIYWEMKRNKIKRDVYLEKSYYKGTYNQFLETWIANIEDKQYLAFDKLKPHVVETIMGWKEFADKVVLVTMRNNVENLYWQLDNLKIKELFDDTVVCKCIDNSNKHDFIKDYRFKHAIVIGDTELDIKLAKDLNVKCVAITNGLRAKKYLNADYYASEIFEIDLAEVL